MKIYLETTVPNFLLADDAPEKREITELFAQWLRLGPHEIYTSELVFDEIAKAEAALRERLEHVLKTMRPGLLLVTDEARLLARINAINRLQGWPMIRINTPKEVLGL